MFHDGRFDLRFALPGDDGKLPDFSRDGVGRGRIHLIVNAAGHYVRVKLAGGGKVERQVVQVDQTQHEPTEDEHHQSMVTMSFVGSGIRRSGLTGFQTLITS